MKYDDLKHFIHKKMRMTHIYQPLMIKALLESNDNTATVEDIAKKFLYNDDSQVNYYKKITKRWPHKTLKKHNIVSYKKDRYKLLIDKKLSRKERDGLIELCDLRLYEFIDKDPWIQKIRELERISPGQSLRYDIFSKAKGVCVACGARPPEASLHVDHIMPVSLGGLTELGNLQALCYRCNTQKRNRDDLDFLRWHKRLQFRKKRCPFCQKKKDIKSNSMAYAVKAKNSIPDMHLIIPNRHVTSFMDLIPAEKQLCLVLVDEVMDHIKNENSAVTDFQVSGFDGRHNKHCSISIVPTRS